MFEKNLIDQIIGINIKSLTIKVTISFQYQIASKKYTTNSSAEIFFLIAELSPEHLFLKNENFPKILHTKLF